jgi:hypothetical protein
MLASMEWVRGTLAFVAVLAVSVPAFAQPALLSQTLMGDAKAAYDGAKLLFKTRSCASRRRTTARPTSLVEHGGARRRVEQQSLLYRGARHRVEQQS